MAINRIVLDGANGNRNPFQFDTRLLQAVLPNRKFRPFLEALLGVKVMDAWCREGRPGVVCALEDWSLVYVSFLIADRLSTADVGECLADNMQHAQALNAKLSLAVFISNGRRGCDDPRRVTIPFDGKDPQAYILYNLSKLGDTQGTPLKMEEKDLLYWVRDGDVPLPLQLVVSEVVRDSTVSDPSASPRKCAADSMPERTAVSFNTISITIAALCEYCRKPEFTPYLSALIGRDIERVEHCEYEKTISLQGGGHPIRGVRLDVVVEGRSCIVDIELQNYPEPHLLQRATYYHSTLSVFYGLKKGDSFAELLPSFVVFILPDSPQFTEARTEIIPVQMACGKADFVPAYHTTIVYNASKCEQLGNMQKEFIRLCQTAKASGTLVSDVGDLLGDREGGLKMNESLREAMERQLRERGIFEAVRSFVQADNGKSNYRQLQQQLPVMTEDFYLEACETLGLHPKWE